MGPRIEDGEKQKKVEKKLRKKQEGNNRDFKRQGNQKKLRRNTDIKKRLLERLQNLQQENIDSMKKQLLKLQQQQGNFTDFNMQQMGNMFHQRLLLTRLGNIDFNRAELEKQRQLLEKVGSEVCDKHVQELMMKMQGQQTDKKIEVDDKHDARLSRNVKPEVVIRRRLDGESILFEVTPSASPGQMEIIEQVVKKMIENVVRKMKFKEESEEVTLGMDKISLG